MAARLRSDDVLATLNGLMVRQDVPEYIRSDNGPDFTAKRVRDRIERIGAKTLFMEPGSPWENGYNESFNGKLRDELLHVERSEGAYRGVEGDVQPEPATQFVGLWTSVPAVTVVPRRLHPDAWSRPQNLRPTLT